MGIFKVYAKKTAIIDTLEANIKREIHKIYTEILEKITENWPSIILFKRNVMEAISQN